MEALDFGSIEYGPVMVVWRHSRIADHGVVVRALRETLPCKVVGLCVPEIDNSQCYIYGVVFWPEGLGEYSTEDSFSGEEIQQWRHEVQAAITNLDTLSLETPLADDSTLPSTRWTIKSYSYETVPSGILVGMIGMEEIQRAMLQNKAKLFGGDDTEELTLDY